MDQLSIEERIRLGEVFDEDGATEVSHPAIHEMAYEQN